VHIYLRPHSIDTSVRTASSQKVTSSCANNRTNNHAVSPTVLKARSTLEPICAGTVDRTTRIGQHILIMAEVLLETPRRSSRIFKRVHVTAEGKNVLGRKFRESCKTIVINAHGALLYLKAELAVGAMVVLSNPFTQEDQECRVVFIGDDVEKGQRVGVEFLSPAPHFWGVDFTPPEDWLKHKYDAPQQPAS
jgi:hypothetical protein